jgi:hypothetical protein
MARQLDFLHGGERLKPMHIHIKLRHLGLQEREFFYQKY